MRARAQAEFEFQALHDGEVLNFGAVRIEVLETPGHTPEGISLVVYDLAVDAERPHAVLTGDTLFLGDVGRPDLMALAGFTAEQLAGMLYDSLHDKLLRLPDDTLVYPGHGAGSLCGKALSSDTVSTLGEQRRNNYALQPMSRDEFVALVAAAQPPAPAYFRFAAGLNGQEHDTLTASGLEAIPMLDGADFLARCQDAQVLDCRDAESFAAAHLPNSIQIGLDGRFATWAGSVLSR